MFWNYLMWTYTACSIIKAGIYLSKKSMKNSNGTRQKFKNILNAVCTLADVRIWYFSYIKHNSYFISKASPNCSAKCVSTFLRRLLRSDSPASAVSIVKTLEVLALASVVGPETLTLDACAISLSETLMLNGLPLTFLSWRITWTWCFPVLLGQKDEIAARKIINKHKIIILYNLWRIYFSVPYKIVF